MTNVSRRSVTKGAAWAAPVVALGASAPALAASPVYPDPPVCPTGAGCFVPLIDNETNGLAQTFSVAALSSTSVTFALNWGSYRIRRDASCMPAGATGYRMIIDRLTITNNQGDTYTAAAGEDTDNFSWTQTVGQTAVVYGAGGAIAVTGTLGGYRWLQYGTSSPRVRLQTVTVDFHFEHLVGLRPIGDEGPTLEVPVGCDAPVSSFTFDGAAGLSQSGWLRGNFVS